VALAGALKQPTLILVHTTDLLNQWRRELAEKSLFPGGIGTWGGGEKVGGQAIVATIQTLVRHIPAELREWLSQFGCVILDEAHHCPAETFMAVFNLCPAKFRFGVTATPRRKDGLDFLMTDVIGPIVSEVTDEELVAEGRSQQCTVREMPTTFYTRYTVDEWNSLLAELTTDEERNNLIIRTVVKDWHEGHFPLILSGRVPHCKMLVERLRANGMNAHLLVGEVSKNVREQITVHAKRGLIDAIVATKVADEGLDIPQLSCIHLTTPTANESATQQRIGRIRRPIEGKTSLVVDYQDIRVPGLLRMAQVRKKLYRRWGFLFEA
jgi:superfamily II DNA or RNA helicase